MDNVVITVARQYGSSGKTIAECWQRNWHKLLRQRFWGWPRRERHQQAPLRSRMTRDKGASLLGIVKAPL
ncbi:MAG: hypothetical protein ACLTMW_02760 [Blautia hydrogenotrophica]